MKILKYKKMSLGKYKIFLDNGQNLTLYEDIILKFNLLIKKELNNEELIQIEKDNNKYMAYDYAIKYIKVKMRCEKEIIDYLKKKNIEDKDIIDIVNQLKEQGYLNKELYINSYIIDKINLNNIGPVKIKQELVRLGFDEIDIDKVLKNINHLDIMNKLDKLITKKINSNKNYNGTILKNKIITYFLEKGFEREDIESIINNKNLNNDNNLSKEYERLYKKYSKKYSGTKLDFVIKQKLYQKGFKYEE